MIFNARHVFEHLLQHFSRVSSRGSVHASFSVRVAAHSDDAHDVVGVGGTTVHKCGPFASGLPKSRSISFGVRIFPRAH